MLAMFGFGRICLHLMAMRPGHMRWHLAGILREFHI
jgi:hypothetical protein